MLEQEEHPFVPMPKDNQRQHEMNGPQASKQQLKVDSKTDSKADDKTRITVDIGGQTDIGQTP